MGRCERPRLLAKGLPGVTYDPTVWQAIVTVKGADAHIELSVAYSKQGATTDAKAFAFENSYRPEPAVATISGTKVFQGRAMTEAESFGFSLVPANKAATDAPGADFAKQATVSGLANDVPKTFSFDKLSFAKPGTYTFKMVENAYCGKALNSEAAQSSHIAFDTHECLVTVKVTDDHSGTCRPRSLTTVGRPLPTCIPRKRRTVALVALRWRRRSMVARCMRANSLSTSKEPMMPQKALLKRVDENCGGVLQFSNPNDRAAGVADVMRPIDDITFTQVDAGKTFEFAVSEVVPGDDGKLAGVTYDGATHVVKIVVSLKGGMSLDVATYVDGKLVESGTPTVAFRNTLRTGKYGICHDELWLEQDS